MDTSDVPPQPDRRDFLAKSCAVVLGGAITLAAPVAGLVFIADPLKSKPGASGAGGAIRVTSLNALPEGGAPLFFPVLATRVDAWNKTENVPIGAIYLQRTKEGTVRALNVTCPHAGCSVAYQPSQNCYFCPCHNSTFATDGKILDAKSPSPRALDELKVEIRNESEVWVTFQNFRAGVPDKIPV